MKILTIAGTRPELIRLSIIIEKLDNLVDHIFVYTNQNYDYNLSVRFFEELKIRKPNYYFNNEGISFGGFFGNAIINFENIIKKEIPDKILILGDTNSGLLSIVAEKYGIPIYHMEAGNRCYDNRLPEETNRKIIDSVSTYNLPYTENSKQNLLKEGFHKNFVFKTGNPIYEVLNKYEKEIDNSNILNELGIVSNISNDASDFALCTFHRSENVDNKDSLVNIINSINSISKKIRVVVSLHPRTKNKMGLFNLSINNNITILDPLGFFSFVKLEKNAKVVISDSGTVQEECCIFGVPALTIRETTERQETIECGSNILCGTKFENITESFDIICNRNVFWNPPSDYLIPNVSDIVINILIGK